jgi:multicomponent Na+:H+ antiporter subunit A
LFWRGHDEPGGGFIAGLVAGSALAVAGISGIHVRLPRPRVILALGLGIALASGVLGQVLGGTFLEPFKFDVPVLGSLTTSLIFDLGVFLVVVGLVRTALQRLDGLDSDTEEDEHHHDPDPVRVLP